MMTYQMTPNQIICMFILSLKAINYQNQHNHNYDTCHHHHYCIELPLPQLHALVQAGFGSFLLHLDP